MRNLARSLFASSTNAVDAKKVQYLDNPKVPSVEYLYEANYIGTYGYTGGNFVTFSQPSCTPSRAVASTLTLRTPQGKPIIDPKYLSNAYDQQALIEAGKFARRIANSEPIKSVWTVETEPSEAVQTDEQWLAFARKAMGSFYHPCGTCAMLPRSKGGVVDSDLQRLRHDQPARRRQQHHPRHPLRSHLDRGVRHCRGRRGQDHRGCVRAGCRVDLSATAWGLIFFYQTFFSDSRSRAQR